MTIRWSTETTAHTLTVLRFRDGRQRPEPILTQVTRPQARPYLHPVWSPYNTGCLTEDAPAHHPWQHGVFVGFADINGVGFWTEGLTGSAADGTFHPDPVTAATVHGKGVHWRVRTTYRDPEGSALAVETQQWSVQGGRAYTLDLAWTLTAKADVLVARYPYGGLFVRMPFRTPDTAQMASSEGLAGPTECDGKRARWLAVAMPLPTHGADRRAGIAVLDAPTNPAHPTPWRADPEFGVSPSRCIAGPWRVEAGAAVTERYRLVPFDGDIDVAQIEAEWRSYATESGGQA